MRASTIARCVRCMAAPYDYFDLDAILVEDERVPVTFRVGAHRLGHLDPAAGTRDLSDGAQLELPHWLASALALKGMVSVELPRKYSQRVRSKLLADPTSLSLRDKSPHYHALGIKLSAQLGDAHLAATLRQALTGRYKQILDVAQGSREEDTSDFARRLTELELRMFTTGIHAARAYHAWRCREQEKLQASRLVRRGTKRRRL